MNIKKSKQKNEAQNMHMQDTYLFSIRAVEQPRDHSNANLLSRLLEVRSEGI